MHIDEVLAGGGAKVTQQQVLDIGQGQGTTQQRILIQQINLKKQDIDSISANVIL
jgi:hypothetical protein